MTEDENSMRISKLPNPRLAFTYAKNSLSYVTWSSVSESSGERSQMRGSAAAPTRWFLRLAVGPECLRRWRTSSPDDLMRHSFERHCVREASFIGVSWDGNHSHLQNRPGTKRVLWRPMTSFFSLTMGCLASSSLGCTVVSSSTGGL